MVSEDEDGGSSPSSVDRYGEGDVDPVPPLRQGWKVKPDTWVVKEEGGALVGYYQVGEDVFQPLTTLEFRRHDSLEGPVYYYRLKVPSSDPMASARDRVRRLSSALPTLAARVAGSPAAHPTVVPKKPGRFGVGLEVGGPPLPSLLSWSGLASLWSIRAAGDKTGPRDREEQRSDSRPFSIEWAPGSPEQAAFSFLGAFAPVQGSLPSSLQKPPAAVLKDDVDARAEAHRLVSVSSCLDVLSSILRAAVAMPQEWSSSDSRSFVSAVADAVEGSAALLAPQTRDKVREAVTKRVALREAAVTKALESSRADLVNLEPLSPFLYGSQEGVAGIIRARLPPAQVELKGSMVDLLRRQSSSFKSSGSGSRDVPYKKKDSHEPRRDSSKNFRAADKSSGQPSQHSSRGSGRGGGRGGGASRGSRQSGGRRDGSKSRH